MQKTKLINEWHYVKKFTKTLKINVHAFLNNKSFYAPGLYNDANAKIIPKYKIKVLLLILKIKQIQDKD